MAERENVGKLWDRKEQINGVCRVLAEFLAIYTQIALCSRRIVATKYCRNEKYCSILVQMFTDRSEVRKFSWLQKSLTKHLSNNDFRRLSIAILQGRTVVERYCVEIKNIDSLLADDFEETELLFSELETCLREQLIKCRSRIDQSGHDLKDLGDASYDIYLVSSVSGQESDLLTFKVTKERFKYCWKPLHDVDECNEGAALCTSKCRICEVRSWFEFIKSSNNDFSIVQNDSTVVPQTPTP